MGLISLPPEGFRNSYERRLASTHVYFVEGALLIKIGFATWPTDRFFAMLTSSPVPLSLLASSPGGAAVENELHHRFAASRSHGEWFRRTPELDAVIAMADVQYGPEYRNVTASLARKVGELRKMREKSWRSPSVPSPQ